MYNPTLQNFERNQFNLIKNQLNQRFDMMKQENQNLKIQIEEIFEMQKQNQQMIAKNIIKQEQQSKKMQNQLDQIIQMQM